MTTRLSRDPALWLSLCATALKLVCAFWINFSPDQQTILNATAAALVGVAVAIWVRRDGQVAAILGAVQALLALAVGFGFHLDAEQQAIIMSFVGTALAAFVRTQVDARVPAEDPAVV
jgi:hypothetical protein